MRYLYFHGFASSPFSRKAQFFRERLATEGIALEIPALDQGDFEHLTITSQIHVITELAAGDPVILMGSSMGGYLAALYAAIHPNVAQMVLLAPAFGFASRWPETFGEETVAQWKAQGYAEIFHYGSNSTRRLSASLLHDSGKHPEYPSTHAPAMIFHGQHDTVVPIAASQRWAAENPPAQLILLDDGHELLNSLELIWTASRDFLLSR